MKNDLDNAKKFFNKNNMEFFSNPEMNVIGKTMVYYAKLISDEENNEILDFFEWASHNDWVYLPSKGYWLNEEQEELEEKITTKQLFEQFKNKRNYERI